MHLCIVAEHTHSVCIIQFEAAEDLVGVSSVEKTIALNDHLETFWKEKIKLNKWKHCQRKLLVTCRGTVRHTFTSEIVIIQTSKLYF